MKRGKHSKNEKKRWGSQMEELATMVERAQLEKIQLTKKRRNGKLSKKQYMDIESQQEEIKQNKGGYENQAYKWGRPHEKSASTHNSPTSTYKHRKSNNSPQTPSYGGGYSTSCPDIPVVPANNGRSISFAGGPNILYSQFNYTYTYEDNYAKIKCDVSSTNEQIVSSRTSLSIGLVPVFQDRESGEAGSSSGSEDSISEDDLPVAYLTDSDDDDENDGDNHNDNEDDDGNDDDEDEDEEDNYDNSSEGSSCGSALDDYIELTKLRFDDSEDEVKSQEKEQDQQSRVRTKLNFSHPDEFDDANITSALENSRVQFSDPEDSDSAYGRRRKRKLLERQRVLQFDLQFAGLEEEEDKGNIFASNQATLDDKMKSSGLFTPQQPNRRNIDSDRPHSWPKKSNIFGPRDGDKRGSDKSKPKARKGLRDKKKKQDKSKYVKDFAGAYGTSTTTRGWVGGGLVKDDLICKFSDKPQFMDTTHAFLVMQEPALGRNSDIHLAPVLPTTLNDFNGRLSGQIESDAVDIPVPNTTQIYTNCKVSKGKKHNDRRNTKATEGYQQTAEKASLSMTPKEKMICQAILDGNFKSLENESSRRKVKSKRYPAFDLFEIAQLVEDCNDFVNTVHRKSMPLYRMTKEQRIQVYCLATLYNFKKDSVGKGSNKSPVLGKSKKSAIPHRNVLEQFILDCAENPFDMKTLYLSSELGEQPPRAAFAKATKERVRFVGENALPVGEENIGNKLLRGMGWNGGGLGAKGEGIIEPISQQMKFSRSGLG